MKNQLTQQQLAELLGVHQSMVCYLETGKKLVSATKAKQIGTVTKGEIRPEQLRPDVFNDVQAAITA